MKKLTIILLGLLAATALVAIIFYQNADDKKPEGSSQMHHEAMKRGTEQAPAVHSGHIVLASDIDPVCHMSVKDGYADTTMYEGKIYGFCAAMCKESFLKSHRKSQK